MKFRKAFEKTNSVIRKDNGFVNFFVLITTVSFVVLVGFLSYSLTFVVYGDETVPFVPYFIWFILTLIVMAATGVYTAILSEQLLKDE